MLQRQYWKIKPKASGSSTKIFQCIETHRSLEEESPGSVSETCKACLCGGRGIRKQWGLSKPKELQSRKSELECTQNFLNQPEFGGNSG